MYSFGLPKKNDVLFYLAFRILWKFAIGSKLDITLFEKSLLNCKAVIYIFSSTEDLVRLDLV